MQPHATARQDALPWIGDILRALLPAAGRPAPTHVRAVSGHSNDIVELTFGEDRVLLVKRARHEWVRPAFTASARAGRLISRASDLVVPQPLPIADPPGLPVQAYWRIGLPTLQQVWPSLTDAARRGALRSLGARLRRLHRIGTPHWGPLHDQGASSDPADALDRELRRRLLPAAIAHWPRGVGLLEALIERIPDAAGLHAGRRPALVHSDLHLGNILCTVDDDAVECVGFLDLDGVRGGCAESDIAAMDVLHGPHFERYIPAVLRDQLRLGYGDGLSLPLIDYFVCVHLANQAFSSALLGHHDHAHRVSDELERQLRTLALPSPAPAAPRAR